MLQPREKPGPDQIRFKPLSSNETLSAPRHFSRQEMVGPRTFHDKLKKRRMARLLLFDPKITTP